MGIPLSTVKNNSKVMVKSIDLHGKIKRKLIEVGILPQLEIKLISKHSGGTVVVSSSSFKVALGGFIADKLMVTVL